MGYREVVTGPPPDLGLSQICHGGPSPALAATSSHRPPLSCLAECAPLLGRPASVCTFWTQPRCYLLRGAFSKHLSFSTVLSLHPVGFFNSSAYVHLIHHYI